MLAYPHCRHCYGDCPGDCLLPGDTGMCIHGRLRRLPFRQWRGYGSTGSGGAESRSRWPAGQRGLSGKGGSGGAASGGPG